ncbi:MAG TPA: hypothetical protein VD994_07400, partial [Prosthecobacter sp.]|nr:hypothetical protein [Prosthecobacter sp.]
GVSKPVSGPMDRPPLPQAPHTCQLVRWLAKAASVRELQDVLVAAQPGWKPGRAADLGFLDNEGWLPLPAAKLVRRLVAALTAVARREAAWMLTAWMLLRDLRPPGSAPRADELEVLLDAAQTARVAGDHYGAVRLTALFLHLLPPQAPEPLLKRARVAAWLLVENGIEVPAGLRVSLDELPFPGDPPTSEKGLEAARAFHDPADPWYKHLEHEMAVDPEWQHLRAASVVLHHPLAALAWIGRKAHAYAVKKQHDLLRAAFVLAARHHLLGTAGKLLAQLKASPNDVLAYAKAMRESLRRMPYLRSSECWQEWAANLRAGWGRLDADAFHDPETVFFLHETLLDREVTTLRGLPMELRLLALRHLHSRRKPSALVQALEADLRLMQQLEHQRAVELWSIGSFIRERTDQANSAWVSLVKLGDADSGKYSLLINAPGGQVRTQGRVKEGWQPVAEEIAKGCGGAERIFLATDAEVGLTEKVARVPSWEWAFRVLRETPEVIPAEVLVPEGQEAPASLPEPPSPNACVLAGGSATVDADTRWVVAGTAERRRSLGIGAHPVVISRGPVRRGELKVDLVRLSLAQATCRFVEADGTLNGVPGI